MQVQRINQSNNQQSFGGLKWLKIGVGKNLQEAMLNAPRGTRTGILKQMRWLEASSPKKSTVKLDLVKGSLRMSSLDGPSCEVSKPVDITLKHPTEIIDTMGSFLDFFS